MSVGVEKKKRDTAIYLKLVTEIIEAGGLS
jgi:hypothetical protein